MRPDESINATSYAYCRWARVAPLTIGPEVDSVRRVTVQLLEDIAAEIPFQPCVVDFYLSDSADGSSVTATAPTAVAIGTKGVLLSSWVVGNGDDLSFNIGSKILTTATGTFDLDITASGPATYWLVFCKPDGSIFVATSPIVFT